MLSNSAVQVGVSRRIHWNSHVERHAAMQPDRVAMRFEGASTTWAQLATRVSMLSDAFAQRGVGAGDRVAVIMGNRPEFIETVLATNRLGAIAVPVNFRLTGPEAAYIVNDCGAILAVVDEFGLPIITAALPEVDQTIQVVVADAECDGFESYAEVVSDGTLRQAVDVPEESAALIMYTSGTTGRPKGAVLSHLNLQAQAVTLMRAFDYIDEAETNLIASPLFHIGAIGSVVPTIFVGGTLVIMPTGAFDATHLVDLLDTESVTSVFLVPTQWQAVCESRSVTTRSLPRLRVLGWGAAPASDTLLRNMSRTFPGARRIALFGQTEMSPVTCVLHDGDALEKLGSVGKPVSTVAMRVVDAQMNDVATGEVGEIVYRGPGLMLGYWNNPAATEEALRGGWFHSGDLVRVDGEGFVYVVDRAKDMIISGGENIYCAEVENVLSAHPDIAEVSLVGQPDPRWGETPVAFLVLRPGAHAPSIETLRSWAASSLAKYKLPTTAEVVETLPRNASGKVLKDRLRASVTTGSVG
ncbi:long-chain-fatty-acid--CoA ligase [Gordonia sp. CPCC 205515]|uniref:long-chain-fatty-acid--CoA ligase n=1 Tax=Gordonia sp. CPCC 205515 TaxID=3140791 RepID=UPI003AF360AD